MVKIKNLKDNNKIEAFDYERLKQSVIRACLSVRRPEGQAEATAKLVCNQVVDWLKQHPEITSLDLRRITTKHLQIFDPEAAYLYSQEHLII